MSIQFNDVLKRGNCKLKRKSLRIWQKRLLILRKPSSRGPRRLECYSEDSLRSSECKTIELTHIDSITRLSSKVRKHAISLNFKDGTSKQIGFDVDSEAEEWLADLLAECNSVHPVLAACVDGDELGELFPVCLVKSSALTEYGETVLHVTGECLRLYHPLEYKEIQAWPLNSLRNYGQTGDQFKFTSGRSSPTGEALFVFNTVNAQRIYEAVQASIRALKAAYRMMKANSQTAPELPARPPEADGGPPPAAPSLASSSTTSSSSSSSHKGLTHSSSFPSGPTHTQQGRALASRHNSNLHITLQSTLSAPPVHTVHTTLTTPPHAGAASPTSAKGSVTPTRRGVRCRSDALPPLPGNHPLDNAGYLTPTGSLSPTTPTLRSPPAMYPTTNGSSPIGALGGYRPFRSGSLNDDLSDMPEEVAPLPTEGMVENVMRDMKISEYQDVNLAKQQNDNRTGKLGSVGEQHDASDEDSESDKEEYIYEEKGLNPQFRKFLKARKDE